MKTKFEKEIKKTGLTLFNYYYNYVDPQSDTGLFRRLQSIKKQQKLKSRRKYHG